MKLKESIAITVRSLYSMKSTFFFLFTENPNRAIPEQYRYGRGDWERWGHRGPGGARPTRRGGPVYPRPCRLGRHRSRSGWPTRERCWEAVRIWGWEWWKRKRRQRKRLCWWDVVWGRVWEWHGGEGEGWSGGIWEGRLWGGGATWLAFGWEKARIGGV